MPKYRVLMTRTRTIKEHAIVLVSSSSEIYCEKDAAIMADTTDAWSIDASSTSKICYPNIEEV